MYLEIIPTAEAGVVSLMNSINRVIINPLILFIFALALVYFIYGLVQFLLNPNNEELRKTSKQHMFWGIIGLFIMTAVFGIMNLIMNTIGVDSKDIKIDNTGKIHIGDVK